MKILFVVAYVPSLVRVRPYNLVRQLSARGHEVTVATVWTNERERAEAAELSKHCAKVSATNLPAWRSMLNCVQALPGSEPLQARYSWSAELHADVLTLAREADVVHVEHLRAARYAIPAPGAGRTPVVWDSVDCITDLFEQAIRSRRDRVGRLINQLELARTRAHEGWLASRFDRVLVTSPLDRDALLNLVDRAQRPAVADRMAVLTNGVDLDYFSPADDPRRPETLVFSGKMSYHANESAVVHLVRDVMPRVWARRPATELVVVGKDPSRRLRGLLAPHASRVTVTGTVPDVRPYLRRASAAVVPLVYGAGCQNKVLEAMACATPVVAMPRAVSALNAAPGRDVLVADGADRFAAAVLDVLESPQRQREIGAAGRRYVERDHQWGHIAARLEAIYEDVVAERSHARYPAVLSA